jgi:hypothetical protein
VQAHETARQAANIFKKEPAMMRITLDLVTESDDVYSPPTSPKTPETETFVPDTPPKDTQ